MVIGGGWWWLVVVSGGGWWLLVVDAVHLCILKYLIGDFSLRM